MQKLSKISHSVGSVNRFASTLILALVFGLYSLPLWSQTILEKEIDSLKSLLPTSSAKEKAILSRTIGSKYKVLAFDSSVFYLTKSLQLAKQIDDDTLVAVSNLMLGSTFIYAQKLDTAMQYLSRSNEQFKTINHPRGISYSYHDLAILYLRKGNYDKSLEYALESLKIKEENNFSTWASHNLIGIIHYENHDWDKALLYGLESLEAAKNKRDSTISYNGIANAYRAKGELEVAEEYVLNTIKSARVIGDKVGLGVYLHNYGEILQEQGKFDRAETSFLEAIEIKMGLKNYTAASKSLSDLAQVFIGKRDFMKADSCIKSSMKLFGNNKNRADKLEILGNAFNVYQAFEKYDIAIDYQTSYYELKDSLYTDEKAALLLEMETKYQTAKKAAEIERQEAKIARLDKEKAIANTRSWILLILTTSLVAVGFLWYRQQKTRRKLATTRLELAEANEEKLKSELDHKNKELVNFALQISSKNEFIKNLKSEIKGLSKDSNLNMKPLIDLVKSTDSIDRDRANFDQYVQLVCEGFFIRLNERYPDISTGEKKLAALIRLGLSSKDIASVFDISPKSVDMNRYRLRKKMALEGDNSLMDKLMEI